MNKLCLMQREQNDFVNWNCLGILYWRHQLRSEIQLSAYEESRCLNLFGNRKYKLLRKNVLDLVDYFEIML